MSNSEKTTNIDISEEMKRSYLDYAMSVVVSRALPDVRDGLKPVHRRILYTMYESGYHYNKQYRKSARIIGDVMGKYHPHGDAAIYDALARMAQDFSLRATLIDGQGNFGSIDGDLAAAMRYTESRLSKLAHQLLMNIDQETVDFRPNYDNSEEEPVVLPSVVPNLLLNGSGGIAVGMATNIPPHNLSEIIDACCLYVDNFSIDIEEIIKLIKGPDFPTGGIILGDSAIKLAYRTGKGIITVRGKAEIEEDSKGKQQIIITEIPYMVNKAKMVEKIAELAKEKKIEGISDLRDESDKSGIRIVVEIKKEATADVVLMQLYTYTSLQTSFGINMLALDQGSPKIMNIKDIIAAFISFRQEVIYRRTIYLLKQAKQKAHLLLGIRVAISEIDKVITLIKASKDPHEAKEKLMILELPKQGLKELINFIDETFSDENEVYYLSEHQAKSILEMRLQRLTNMEKYKIDQELEALVESIKEYNSIISSKPKLLEILKQELLKIKADFSTPRLTTIAYDIEKGGDIEDLIEREEMVVTITLSGYIKRVPLSTYKSQKRGGKGRIGLSMNENDITTQVFVATTHTQVLFFSTLGQVYSLKVYQLPLAAPQSKGRSIVNLLPLKQGESINNVLSLPENEIEWHNLNIIFVTSKGNIRRNDLLSFKHIPTQGKIAIRLEDDILIGVRLCNIQDHIMLATKYGKCIRFPVETVRIFKSRTSEGVRGIKIKIDDRVIGVTILDGANYDFDKREIYLSIPLSQRYLIACGTLDFNIAKEIKELNIEMSQVLEMANKEQFILTVTSNGYGKCTSAYEYRITNRGGSGVTNIAISDKTGEVVSVLPIVKEDEIMLITNAGKLIRCQLDKVRITGRNTRGVILFKTADDEKVTSVAFIAEKDYEESE